MTRDEAVKKAEECFQFNVPGQEWFFTPLRLVAAMENLGLLKFEEPRQTLWELLRKHGVAIDRAQAICNEAMLRGVKAPQSPPNTPEAQT